MSPSRSLVALPLFALLACQGPSSAPAAGPGAASAPAPAADKPADDAQPVAAATGDPLAPLVPVIAHLEKGAAAFLAGGDLPTAFAPWPIHRHDAAGADKIRADIKAAGGTAASHPIFEFELIFAEGDRDALYLRTSLLGSAQQVRFVAIEGRTPDGGKVGVASYPLTDFTGPAQPFRAAAEALVAALRGPGCKDLALVSADELARVITVEAARTPLVDGLERARQHLPALCDQIAALKRDEVRLRLDDQSFIVAGDDGLTRGALKCDFEVLPGQGIEYGVKGFRPMTP